MKPISRIFCSVSGGKTSAVMASMIREQYPFAEIKFAMANTGLETYPTMQFARNVSHFLNLDVALVEAVVHPGRKASTHKVVTWETAAMDGAPMRAVIEKYGVPTQAHHHCTRETKTNPLKSWLAAEGWMPGTYRIALGIRADELHRINPGASRSATFMYPLAERGMTIEEIDAITEDWPFRLAQPAHEGNCKDCHKKSELKTVINFKNHPEWFDFAIEMDAKYGRGRKRYRGNRTALEMRAFAEAVETADPRVLSNSETGCSTECHPWQ